MANEPARETPEWWLRFYEEGLERERKRERPSVAVMHDYIDAIGRTYLYLGKPERARPYLARAAQLCLDILQEPRELAKTNPADRGRTFLGCAQGMWRIGDPRAKSLFQQAINWLEKGIASEDTSVRKRALWLAGITYLFMGDFRRAREALDESMALWVRSDVPEGEEGLSLLAAVRLAAEALEAGDVERMQQALVDLKRSQRKSGAPEFGRSPHPGRAVAELLARRLPSPPDQTQNPLERA